MYWASVAAIAGLFWPKKFVATSAINRARLNAITPGGTVIANAASKAAAAARAWIAVFSATDAPEATHVTYGATAAPIDADEGPTHDAFASSEIPEPYPVAAVASS